MTLQQLRYFCMMAEVLHYTHAAELLYISQPSLSYALSQLEKDLGVQLFEKEGKSVSLTRNGEEFLPYAKRALAELSRGQERLKELSAADTDVVNLGYIYSIGFSVLPDFVDKYSEQASAKKASFRFHQGMTGLLIEQLLNGTLELAIARNPEIDSIEAIPIAKQELILAVPNSHPLAKKKTVTLKDIAGEKLISISHDAVIYRQLADKFKSVDFTPNIAFEADEFSSIAVSVAAGDGIAIMPRLPMMKSYNLKVIKFADQTMSRDICLLRYALHTMSPAVKEVWDYAEKQSRLIDK